jgi:hypothetical protein
VSSGEIVDDRYVQAALSVHDRILKDDICRLLVLSVPPVQKCMPTCVAFRISVLALAFAIRQADEEFGRKAPWNSVFKLEWVLKKAGTGANARRRIVWQLSGINDALRTRQVAPGDLCVNRLSGERRGLGPGMLDQMLFKLDLLDELINHQADLCGLLSDAKTIMQAAFESHSSYRAHVGDNANMTWMLTLPQSVKKFAELVGDRC